MELGDDDSDYDYQYESHSDEDVYMDYDMDDVEDGYANAERDTGFARQQLKHAMLGSDEPMKCSITERKQMKREMYKMVDEVAEVLCLPKDDVVLLLNYFNWDDQKLKTKWFDNETQIRQKSGVSAGDPAERPDGVLEECGITADDDIPYTECEALPCGHWFSYEGWGGVIQQLISQKRCVGEKCPQDGCNEKIRGRLFRQFCTSEQMEIYDDCLLDSFVARNPHAKFCPTERCEYMFLYSGGGACDVLCRCNRMYCFNCLDEAHRPAGCDSVKEWRKKNNSESENTQYIMAYTKPCPNCNTYIEKAQGCNHMTCKNSGCNHEFCWVCLGPWKEHGTSTGGYYACNKYSEKAKTDNRFREFEQSKNDAKQHLDKYMHYFSRYINHEKAQTSTQSLAVNLKGKLNDLQCQKGLTYKDVECLENACSLLMEARRVLKWTYVFGYYCTNSTELNLFEFLQEDLEKNVEYLQELVELREETHQFLNGEISQAKMFEYLREVRNYISLTQKFMQELVNGVENGLTEAPQAPKTETSTAAAASSEHSDNVTKASQNGSAPHRQPKPPSSRKNPKRNAKKSG